MSPRWTATVGRRAEGSSALHTPVPPPAEEFHKPQVAQHLQLLPDFVAHVPVVRMQLLQLRGKRVYVLKRELGLAEPPHDAENIKRPAAGCPRYSWSGCNGYAILSGIEASGF